MTTNSVVTGGISKKAFDINALKKGAKAIVKMMASTGIAGFKFNITKQEQIKLISEITDHYVDSNTPVQDHMALKPVTITLNGLEGDYFHSVNTLADILAKILPALNLIIPFMPKLSAATKQIKNKAAAAKKNKVLGNMLKKGISAALASLNPDDLWNWFQLLYKIRSPQTRAFLFFEYLWRSKSLFSVETSWKRYDNMVITNLTPLRDNNADITDFSITFKQINITSTQVTKIENTAGRLKEQMAPVTNKGVDKGQEVPTK